MNKEITSQTNTLCTTENLKILERFAPYNLNSMVDVNAKMYNILVDWFMEVTMALQLSTEALFGAVCIINAYLAKRQEITRDLLQLYGAAALVLSSKLNDVIYAEITDVLSEMDGYTKKQLEKAEVDIFVTLGGNISFLTTLEFTRRFSQDAEFNATLHKHAKAFVTCTLLSEINSRYPQSLIAAAAHYIVAKGCKDQKISQSIYMFGTENDIVMCAVSIMNHLKHLTTCIFFKSCNKYLTKIYSLSRDACTCLNKQYLNVLDSVAQVQVSDVMEIIHEQNSVKRFESIDWSTKTMDTISTLGEGTFGVVKHVLIDHQDYAYKKLRGGDVFNDGVPATYLREIACLLVLKHPNIVTIHGFYSTEGMILELLDMTLKTYIEQHIIKIKTSHILQNSIIKQIISAVSYFHSMGFLHRDLKPQNILVSTIGEEVIVKICDFGLVRGSNICNANSNYTQTVCTLWYRSPELLLGSKTQSHATDMWSLGCIIYEVLTGRTLFRGDSEIDQLYNIFRILGTPTEMTWPGCFKLPEWNLSFPYFPKTTITMPSEIDANLTLLINMCLTYTPNQRPFAWDLISIFYPPPVVESPKKSSLTPTKYKAVYLTPPKKAQARITVTTYIEMIKNEQEKNSIEVSKILGEVLMFVGHTRKGWRYLQNNKFITKTLKTLYENYKDILLSQDLISERVCQIFSVN